MLSPMFKFQENTCICSEAGILTWQSLRSEHWRIDHRQVAECQTVEMDELEKEP